MASLIFAHSKSVVTRAKKEAHKIAAAQAMNGNTENYNDTYEKFLKTFLDRETKNFTDILDYAEKLHDVYKERLGDRRTQYYIVIRPDSKKIKFEDFYKFVVKFCNRACIYSYTVTFEQTGTSDESLGDGFHANIVCDSSWRSKGECLRSAQSTFRKICDDQFIHVTPTKNPSELIENYLIKYESKDGHKITTKEWDSKWRTSIGLKDVYESAGESLPTCLTSPIRQVGNSETPFIVDLS